MLVERDQISIQKSADFPEHYFGIGDLSIVLGILRDKLYSNPIQSLVQEIVCNARDAHREVGAQNVPVEVGLPNHLKEEFYVRDFGPGITPDRMCNIFIQYGASTKRDSNEQTGGYGIGAKSPFAYSDSFTIETVTNETGSWTKRIYAAFIDETHVGKLTLLETAPTDEPRGTKIIVPCKRFDERKFENAISRACRYWTVKPNVVGNTVSWEEDEQFKNRYNQSYWFGCGPVRVLLLDGIPYEMNQRVIEDATESWLPKDWLDNFAKKWGVTCFDTVAESLSKLIKHNISLVFGAGELVLSASREHVAKNKRNSQVIFLRLLDVLVAELERWTVKLEAMPSFWDACVCMNSRAGTIAWDCLAAFKPFKYKGRQLLCSIQVTDGLTCRKYQNKNGTVERELRIGSVNIADGIAIMYGKTNDIMGRVRNLVKDGYQTVYVIKPSNPLFSSKEDREKHEHNWQIFLTFIKENKDFPFFNAEEVRAFRQEFLPFPKQRVSSGQVKIHSGHTTKRYAWENVDISTLSGKMVFVCQMDKGNPSLFGKAISYNDLWRVSECLHGNGHESFVIVKKNKNTKMLPGWMPLEQVCTEIVRKLIPESQDLIIEWLYYFHPRYTHGPIYHNSLEHLAEGGVIFKEIAARLKKLKEMEKRYQALGTNVKRTISLLLPVHKDSLNEKDVESTWAKQVISGLANKTVKKGRLFKLLRLADRRYPLIGHITFTESCSKKLMVQYIKTVDKSRRRAS